MGQQTLEQQACAHNNDYTNLEAAYRRVTGSELVCDPYESVRHPISNLTLSASVVIPAWNARDTLEQCLIAIEQCSFNRKYPELFNVIVVDRSPAILHRSIWSICPMVCSLG